jgi:hypothetical protein
MANDKLPKPQRRFCNTYFKSNIQDNQYQMHAAFLGLSQPKSEKTLVDLDPHSGMDILNIWGCTWLHYASNDPRNHKGSSM